MSDDSWVYSVNYRPGAAPQISFHANDHEELYERAERLEDPELQEKLLNVAGSMTATYNVIAGLGKVSASAQPAAASGRQMDPQGRSCGKCGKALYLVEGEKNGRKWKAWSHEEDYRYGCDRHWINDEGGRGRR